MELEQLRCFVAVAEELHFGRAAQKAGMLPASLGRHIRLLEASLGTPLLIRTTRSVALTDEGGNLLKEIRPLLARFDEIAEGFRANRHHPATILRIGTIDSAAAGLVPQLLHDFRELAPEIVTQLVEDKSIRLVPKLLAGGLDIILMRPREGLSRSLVVRPLLFETAVVAMPANHRLAELPSITIQELPDEPLIVPERRSRPHSHDLTMALFAEAGLQPRIAQIAEEKQTIINLVAAGIGLAIVPRWTSNLAVNGVRYLRLNLGEDAHLERLPLAMAWVKAVRDPIRDKLVTLLETNLERYAAVA